MKLNHLLVYSRRLTPVKIDDFIRYCNVRRKHAIIDTLEFDQTMAIEAKQRKNNKQGISFLFAHRNKGKNQNQVLSRNYLKSPGPIGVSRFFMGFRKCQVNLNPKSYICCTYVEKSHFSTKFHDFFVKYIFIY